MQTTVRIQGLARAFDKIVKNADMLIYCMWLIWVIRIFTLICWTIATEASSQRTASRCKQDKT